MGSWTIISVLQFGAVGDGVTDDTRAFRAALGFLAAVGGGQLLVNGFGRRYRTLPLELTSHMVLYLEEGATLSAMSDVQLWPLDPPFPSYGGPWHYTYFLGGKHVTNVTIVGEGRSSIVDGQGAYWWERRRNHSLQHGPGHLIEFLYSNQIRLWNLHLVDSPSWNVHFYDCTDVHVKQVHIVEPESAPFVDGFDPDSCRNVLIEDSTYQGGDDCVAIKSGSDCFGIDYGKPSVNITIRNLTCHGFSAGIAIGSEMSGGVENVTIENVLFTKANKPADIKVGKTRGGYVRNVVFRNITVTGTIQRAIHVDMFHYNDSPNRYCPKGWKPPTLSDLSNLTFVGFDGRNASYIDYQHRPNTTFHFYAYPESPIRNVYLQDLYFPDNTYGVNWNCNAVEGVVINHTVHPWPPCDGFTILDENHHHHHSRGEEESVSGISPSHALAVVLGALLLVRWWTIHGLSCRGRRQVAPRYGD